MIAARKSVKSLKLSPLRKGRSTNSLGNGNEDDAKGHVLPSAISHSYELLPRQIGGGGFSSVYLAIKRKQEESMKVKLSWRQKAVPSMKLREATFYAVKICQLAKENVAKENERLESSIYPPINVSNIAALTKEVMVMRELRSCENVVTLHEAFVLKPKRECWIVTEALAMDLLKIEETGLLAEERFENARRSILQKVAQGLAFMKKKRYIHADVKQMNVLLSMDGEVKLCDFGTAIKVPKGTRSLIACGDEGGTGPFKAPELLVKGLTFDYGVDVWAFGMLMVTTYEFGETLFGHQRTNESNKFGLEQWKLWNFHHLAYFSMFLGNFTCSPREIQAVRDVVAKETGSKEGRANIEMGSLERGYDEELYYRNLAYSRLLRQCLVPNVGDSPLGDPSSRPLNLTRATIEEVLQAEYFTQSQMTKLEKQTEVAAVVHEVSRLRGSNHMNSQGKLNPTL